MSEASVDLLLEGQLVLPEPGAAPLPGAAVAVADGRVVELGDAARLRAAHPHAEHRRLDRHLLMPGLVNAHGHLAMSLFRGLAADRPLMEWLTDVIWPLEGRWVDDGFVADGARLACAEMIRRGTTTISDMYFFPEVTAAVAASAGLRAQLAFPVFDMPNRWAAGADACIDLGLRLADAYRHDPRVGVVFGPHSTYATDRSHLRRIATLAAEIDAAVHVHCHESADELVQNQERHGARPLRVLEDCGLLGPGTQLVHMTQVTPQEMDAVAAAGASVIHCPASNAKLASGAFDFAGWRDRGVPVGLGTDGAASNNTLNLLAEVRQAALLSRARGGLVPVAEFLGAATSGGAAALGLGDRIGRLAPGFAADVIAVDVHLPELAPLHEATAQLVFADAGPAVTHVWVDGRCLLDDRRLTTLDEGEVLAAAARWRHRLDAPEPGP